MSSNEKTQIEYLCTNHLTRGECTIGQSRGFYKCIPVKNKKHKTLIISMKLDIKLSV